MIPTRTKVLLVILLCTASFAGGFNLGFRAGVKDGADRMYKAATAVIQKLQKRCGFNQEPSEPQIPDYSPDGQTIEL